MTRPGPSPGPPGAQAALSRDLAELLIEFSIAINKYAMYPGGHPSLGPAAERVLDRLASLLLSRDSLSIGVARHQLVIEGVATDPKNPVLADLAGRLHRHQLGAVTFRRGIDVTELRSVLEILAIEADRSGAPLGLAPAEQLNQWRNVRLYPMNYERLELVEGEAEERKEQEGRTRAAQLWIGLARAALAGEAAPAEDTPVETDPTVVAGAIAQHPASAAYDQVIVGYMLQIAEELRSGQGREAVELRQRMSRLVSSLDPGTLHRLLEMGGDRRQRRRFLLDASQGLAVDAVVELVRAAADARQQTVSHSMLRMLQKLAQHAERSVGRRRAVAEVNAREQIAELIRDWSLKDPNPDAYREALQRMSSAQSVFAVSPEQRFKPEARRILQIALEVDELGEPVTQAVERLLDAGELAWVLETLEACPNGKVAEAIWRQVASPERIAAVARSEPLDALLLDRLLAHADPAVADALLDVLAESESSQTRRILLDRIPKMGPAVGPLVLQRLPDERWFVTRNLLAILGQLPKLPPDFDATPYFDHSDARVRREVLRLMVRDPVHRDRAIARAIADGDPRTVQLGLSAALETCPEVAVPQVAARATSAPSRDLRLLAVRVLGVSRSPMALEALLSIAAPKKTLLGAKLPPKTPELLAALAALRQHGEDRRVARVLDLAARSRDTEIVRAAGGEEA